MKSTILATVRRGRGAVLVLERPASVESCQIGHFVPKLRPQSGHLQPLATTVCCGRMQQYLRDNREDIHGVWPPQFTVAGIHNL